MSEINKRGNVLKVTELGLQDRVYSEMKKPKFSVEALTRILNEEGVDITAQSIRKFIKKTKKAQQELIQSDLQTATELTKTIKDYGHYLKKIMTEIEEVAEETKGDKDYATYNQMVGRLMQGVELIAKLTGDIKSKGSVDINIIYNEINNDMANDMRRMKREIFKDTIIDIDADILEADLQSEKEIKEGENSEKV